jgi:hypothetical protein
MADEARALAKWYAMPSPLLCLFFRSPLPETPAQMRTDRKTRWLKSQLSTCVCVTRVRGYLLFPQSTTATPLNLGK